MHGHVKSGTEINVPELTRLCFDAVHKHLKWSLLVFILQKVFEKIKMKFKVDLGLSEDSKRKSMVPGANTGKRVSVAVGQPSDRHKPLFGKLEVESWNDIREIGSHEAWVKHTDPDFDHQALAMQEGHDWEKYIVKFNEQYKEQLKKERYRDRDSISTIEESQDKLLENRRRRLQIYRKLFLWVNFWLWILFLFLLFRWYDIYIYYPVSFIKAHDNEQPNLFEKVFSQNHVYLILLFTLHCYIIGSFGFMAATCFRERPNVLKQYILRMPYMMIIPTLLIVCGVKFTGEFSTVALKERMEYLLTKYHVSPDPRLDNDPYNALNSTDVQSQWIKMQQSQSCCGVYNKKDWLDMDHNLFDDIHYIPKSCCPTKWWRHKYEKPPPPPDECQDFNKKSDGGQEENGEEEEYLWAYPEGCLQKGFEWFKKQAAFFVGYQFISIVSQGVAYLLGWKYYTTKMKTRDIKFKYHAGTWMKEIFFWDWFTYCFCPTRLEYEPLSIVRARQKPGERFDRKEEEEQEEETVSREFELVKGQGGGIQSSSKASMAVSQTGSENNRGERNSEAGTETGTITGASESETSLNTLLGPEESRMSMGRETGTDVSKTNSVISTIFKE